MCIRDRLYFRHRALSIQRSQLFRSLEAKPTRGSRDARALRGRRGYKLASREQKTENEHVAILQKVEFLFHL